MILTSTLIATRALVVMLLVRRVAPSAVSVAVISALVIVASPRPYDFDKFFFLPARTPALLAIHRPPYIGKSRLAGGTAVIAGMFRYDNGMFI